MNKTHLAPSIILVSPQGAGNVGGVARLCRNFGISDLRLVEPRCDHRSLEAQKMAMHGDSILSSLQIFNTLEEALKDQTMAVAVSKRQLAERRPSADCFTFNQNWNEIIPRDASVAFVFGREDRGLSVKEMQLCQWLVEIPTHPEYDSLNLVSATAVVTALWSHHWMNPLKLSEKQGPTPPSQSSRQAFFEELTDVLTQIKFLNPQNPGHIFKDLHAIYERANLSERELRILFGVITQVKKNLVTTEQQ